MKHTLFTQNFTIPNGVKVISFDVFDTLILRPFATPSDLFSFLSPFISKMMDKKIDFRHLRKKVEKYTRQKAFPREEITIDEIYDNFIQIPVKLRGGIKFLEIETELKLCFARKSGQILYQMAKEAGLKIIAISDIYLETPILTKLLNKNGFYFDEVFSSASLKKRKKTGSIYPEILNILGVSANQVLHIGDNEVSDITKAREAGIHTFYLPLLRQEFYQNSLYKNLLKKEKCVLTSVSVGLILERLESEKNIERFSLFGGNPNKIGFNAFGPIIFAYSMWVNKQIKKHNIKKVFFVARDGFIMQKAFQILFNNVEVGYLECSRRSLLPILIQTKEDVMHHFTRRYRNATVEEFITQKLECNPQKALPHLKDIGFTSLQSNVKRLLSRKKDKKRLEKLVQIYADEIFQKMQQERGFAMKYLEKSGVLEGSIALCDVGYGGTTQKIINKIRGENGVFGLYLITNIEAKPLQNAFGFLSEKTSKLKFKIFSSFIRLMETIIFSAPTGTVNNYNENGDPIFESLKPEEKRRLELNSFIWKGMLDFIISIKKHFGKEVEFITFNKNSISKVFLNFCLNPTKKDAEMLEEVVFENKSNAGGYKSLIEDGVWKMGRISIKNPLLYKFLKPFLKILLKYKLFKN